jgi:hypothetical protein
VQTCIFVGGTRAALSMLMPTILTSFLSIVLLLNITSRVEAQETEVPPPPSFQLRVSESAEEPSRANHILRESLAWAGSAGVAMALGVGGLVLALSDESAHDHDSGPGLQNHIGGPGVGVMLSGIAMGVFGIPAAVWLAGGRDGSYLATLLTNLAGAFVGVGIIGFAADLYNDGVGDGSLVAVGCILGAGVNMAAAILGFELSRPRESVRASSRVTLVPTVAPTARLDGLVVGMGGAF